MVGNIVDVYPPQRGFNKTERPNNPHDTPHDIRISTASSWVLYTCRKRGITSTSVVRLFRSFSQGSGENG